MSVRIDLRTVAIPDDLKIWAVHAGKYKRHFQRFIDNEVIFLDYPDFSYTRRVIENNELTRKHIARAEKIHDYVRLGGDTPPPQNIDRYPSFPNDRSLNNAVTNIQRFYSGISVGDLVIIPPRRAYDPIYFGIVTTEVLTDTIPVPRYDGRKFQVRKVRWVDVTTAKRSLSSDLAIRLENPHAIIEIDRPAFGTEVFSKAFPNYISQENSKTDVNCPRYRGKNPLETEEVQKLVAFFIATQTAQIQGTLDDLRSLSFNEIIYNYYDPVLVADLQNEFHSPGFYRLIATAGVVLGVSVGIQLAVTGSISSDTIANAEITNSATDWLHSVTNIFQTTLEPDLSIGLDENKIREDLKEVLDTVSPEALVEVNRLGTSASQELGANTGIKITQ